MSPAGPDRALRQLVADLSQARPDDVEAVLDDLSEDQQARVRRLLREYLGEPPAPAELPGPPARARVRLRGLSPWLAARLDKASGEPAEPPGPSTVRRGLRARAAPPAFNMTPHALAMLLDSAEAVARAGGDAAALGAAPERRRLLSAPLARLFGGAGR